MKRTIKEVYDLIAEKRKNATAQLKIEKNPSTKKLLHGEINSYQDVLCLIEGSDLLPPHLSTIDVIPNPVKGSGLEALYKLYWDKAVNNEYGYNGRSRENNEKFRKECKELNDIIEQELKALEIIKPLVYIFWNMGGYGEIRLAESGRRIKQYIPKNEYELLKEAGFEERYYYCEEGE